MKCKLKVKKSESGYIILCEEYPGCTVEAETKTEALQVFQVRLEEVLRLNRISSELVEEIEVQVDNNNSLQSVLSFGLGEVHLEDAVNKQSTPTQKLNLFRSLFRGREDVYAVRWQDRKGRSGYSPACANEWKEGTCGKARGIKCFECENRRLLEFSDHILKDHLTGRKTIGIYPLLKNETCWFLALDFDKEDWRDNITAFVQTCQEFDLNAYVERSRSGNGGHVWLFFEEPVHAVTARKLGKLLLSRTIDRRYQVDLRSYDRLFPNQDHMPQGGFGNLIALPLQKVPRKKGFSEFVDADFCSWPDQWEFLSSIQKVTQKQVQELVDRAEATSSVTLSVGSGALNDSELSEVPWKELPSQKEKGKPYQGVVPAHVQLVSANMLYIKKAGLSPGFISRLMRLATFHNPEFYKAKRSRRSTWGIERYIRCAEDLPDHLALPRGLQEDVIEFLEQYKVGYDVVDERNPGKPIEIGFSGQLRTDQLEAMQAMIEHENGIIVAGTGFGKTVLAIALLAQRGVSTLILVNRVQLLEQWISQLKVFSSLDDSQIGQVGAGKSKPSGFVDVAMLQSLNRKGKVEDLVTEYGHVVIDECHHIPAYSFETVLKQVRAKYILGLTATLQRRDGLQSIISMQCSKVRYQLKTRDLKQLVNIQRSVLIRNTGFEFDNEQASLAEIFALMVTDEKRNQLIVQDVVEAVNRGRFPLVLTERVAHLQILEAMFARFSGVNLVVFRGGMGKKQRKAATDSLAHPQSDESRIVLATGRYIGEGFDDQWLDTLFLSMPVAWKGILHQYVGRLHREHANKTEVKVYDYLDANVPMLKRMHEKRLKGYKSLGYSVSEN